MLHVLRTEGARVLMRKLHRRLSNQALAAKGPPTLLRLAEPFTPIVFPDAAAPSISVIIPVQRSLRSIHHCLAALVHMETRTPFEVILAADLDDDRAWRLRRYPGVRLIQSAPGTTLPQRLNQAAQRTRSALIAFLSDDTQVQPGWLDTLVQTFAETADAGIIGSRLLYPDGRQHGLGWRIDAQGIPHPLGHLADPEHPACNYRRPVAACSLTALAIRADLFHQIGGFAPEATTPETLAIYLAQRVWEQGHRVYCQPLSRVVWFRTEDRQVPLDPTPLSYPLPLYRPSLSIPAQRLRVLVVDNYMITPDRESGSLRMLNLFLILQRLGYQVTFAAANLEAPQPYVAELQRQGCEVLYRPYVRSLADHLAKQGARYRLVILSRADAASQTIEAARRYCVGARIIFDTVDLHFLRESRLATLLGDRGMRLLAEARKRQELALMRQADLTWVVSEAERAILAAEAPDVPVQVVSNIHRIFGSANPPAARRDLLFIGAFSHPPNRDAVCFFCDQVMPIVRRYLPEVRFQVIGADPPPEILTRAGDGVELLGHVPDVAPFFANCRLSVAPLRYGAGVKGKINQSLAYGVPVVATSVAVEGMHLVNGESVLIADTPEGLAEAVIRLYQDDALWERLSQAGIEVMERHFSFDAAERTLRSALALETAG
ncbi:glycosyltransferase [Caldichromatium japonicum]|uniref:Glycosyltransferase n=2 Tax=Caldichromatium japonicum TaxID=2699430 RepID=A0A6G7VHA9_9GAMM|nr:glycosyltransferase [Caldichromatium japonicum]